jgi:hypothetical protein
VKLPNGEQSRVDGEKEEDYLLSVTHPEGSGKAEFFSRFGFRSENWMVLRMLYVNTLRVIQSLKV